MIDDNHFPSSQPTQEPAAWDGRLPDTLQKSLNALYLECPEAVVREHSYHVRSAFEAICTSLATTQRMFKALQAKVPVDEGGTAAPAATQPAAWVHEDDPARVISAAQKAQALMDGGASASSVRPYSIPAAVASQPEGREAWQPIETAPKDGSTEVDLWFPTAGRRTSWRWYRKGEYWGSIPRHRFQRVDTCDEQPTHWQPPPAPPAVQAGGGKS